MNEEAEGVFFGGCSTRCFRDFSPQEGWFKKRVWSWNRRLVFTR